MTYPITVSNAVATNLKRIKKELQKQEDEDTASDRKWSISMVIEKSLRRSRLWRKVRNERKFDV